MANPFVAILMDNLEKTLDSKSELGMCADTRSLLGWSFDVGRSDGWSDPHIDRAHSLMQAAAAKATSSHAGFNIKDRARDFTILRQMHTFSPSGSRAPNDLRWLKISLHNLRREFAREEIQNPKRGIAQLQTLTTSCTNTLLSFEPHREAIGEPWHILQASVSQLRQVMHWRLEKQEKLAKGMRILDDIWAPLEDAARNCGIPSSAPDRSPVTWSNELRAAWSTCNHFEPPERPNLNHLWKLLENQERLEGEIQRLNKQLQVHLPQPGDALAPVAKVIEDAHQIVDLLPGWDGEGGLGCSQATWQRAKVAILADAKFLLESHGKVVIPFRVMPDLEGGIDVHWRSGDFELLLNVQPKPSEPITFFGNSRERHATCKTSGEMLRDQTVNLGIIAWLAQMT